MLWEGGQLAAEGAEQHKPKFFGIDIPTYHWDSFDTYWTSTGKKALKQVYEEI